MRRVIAFYLAIFAGSFAYGVHAAAVPGTGEHPSTGHMVDRRTMAPEPTAIHMSEVTIKCQPIRQATKLASASRASVGATVPHVQACHSRQLQAVPNGRAVYGTVQVCE